MSKKILWLLVNALIVLSLVMAACGTAEPKTTPPETTPPTTVPPTTAPPTTPPPTQEQQQKPSVATEAPKYGGTLAIAQSTDPTNFDEGVNRTMSGALYAYTHEELSMWDWTRGPAGTGELDMTINSFHKQEFNIGTMAESWEIAPPDRIIIHIRQGVHFSLNPAFEASRLVGGREMTAEDVVFTFKRLFSEPGAYLRNSYPALAKVIQIAATDKHTIDVRFTAETFMEAYHTLFTFAHIVAPELVQKYGDLQNWRVQVGTGPFMISDLVPGSSIILIRNPNYWMKDPIGTGKGNQLPYIDSIRLMVVPDTSTRQAALRTGKIDQNSGYSVEDRDLMLKNSPKLQYKEYVGGGASAQAMKIYDPGLPFHDVRVRRAMIMAIDYKTIVKEYYKGAAEYFNFPQPLLKGYESIWVPLEEMPGSVQELYTYDPEKAKQLLKEAGYPNGFKTNIIITNTAENIDYMSVIADYWAKVGIELNIEPKETGAYNTIWRNFTYPEMIMAGTGGIGSYYRLIGISGPDYWNPSQVNEPYIEEVRQRMADIVLSTMDWNEIDRLYKELRPRVVDQAYMIPSPSRYSYNLWWPWLKNYHGEMNTSFAGPGNGQTRFVWMDRDLKKSMGH